MSDSPNTPMYVGDRPQESFFQTWTRALTQPREETYAEMATSPGANPSKAYVWVFLAALISYFFIFAAQALILGGGQNSNFGSSIGTMVGAVICGAPILAGISVLGFMLVTAIIQWVAGLFGGQGNYNQLAYVLGAIGAPVSLISGVISAFAAIPYVGVCLSIASLGIGIYALVLEIMAVKSVNRFGWGPAIGSVLLPGLVVLFACACVTIAVLTLMAPIIGNVFSEINQSLMVP